MYLGLVLIVMIVSGTFILLSLQSIELDKSRAQLETYAQKIVDQVIMSYDESGFQTGLTTFTNSGTAEVQGSIINKSGETIASTSVSQPPFPQYRSSVIVSAMAGNEAFDAGSSTGSSTSSSREWMSYAVPVTLNGEIAYIVFAQMDASTMQASLDQTRGIIVVAVLLALLLTVIMGVIFAKTLTSPILALTAKAKELAEGKLDQKVKVKSNDEIGQLTESFNFMALQLNKTLSEMSKEKNKLEIILHNMTDGVISFDTDGNVVHVNSASLEMLGLDEMKYNFSQFIKIYDINSNVYLDADPEKPKQAIFPAGNLFIKASFSPNINEKGKMEGLVVVLQDITEQKRLDDMRKEFVANVSHELRTPLTTIKSYTETLIDGALDQKDVAMEFLEIVDGEADRMTFLVSDLLQLSRFDNNQIKLNWTKINLLDFLEECVRQNRIHAENKRQTLIFEPCREDIYLTVDRDRAAQVLNNILTNAIKYSLEEAQIKVSVAEDDLYYKIQVKDTGLGIQKEDLPRIFERFYRVDKARSRAMGGTGLGLAIAKEIMEIHGGRITAESEYGKGTLMTMWFLKNPPLEEPAEVEI